MPNIFIEAGQLFTEGNNPWIDGITYNGKWGEKSPVWPTTLKIKLLQPNDQRKYKLNNLAWYQARANSTDMGGWKSKGNPIGRIGRNQQKAIKNSYKSWSDLANINAEFVENPKNADVIITLAKYKNKGFIPGWGTLGGSHRGLVAESAILEINREPGSNTPLSTQQILGTTAIPSPTPLILDLNYDIFKYYKFTDPSFIEVIIHEIGHGIGMSHPHDQGLGSVPSGIFPGITRGDSAAINGTGLYGLNQNVYTIMSYNRNVPGTGETEAIHAITPMALETLAAQIKYGQNKNTNAGKTIYDLNDRTDPNKKAWQCIWDVGGKDTITAQGSQHDVIINLRPAEMNTSRPETGEPHEQYQWGKWSEWQSALDFLINSKSSRPGTLLGSGVKQAFNISYSLNNIISRKDTKNIKQDLEILSESLLILYQEYDFNRALPLVLGELRLPKTKKRINSAVEAAKKAYSQVDEYLNQPIINALAQSPSKLNRYIHELTQTVDLQSTIQDRSARGVAGHISQVSRQAIQELKPENRPGGGFTIAAGVTIEHAIGGRGNDVITGNYANNLLIGRGGDDLIKPYLGNNRIRGGAGKDSVDLDDGLQSFSIEDYTFATQRGWDVVTNNLTGDTNRLRRIETIIVDGEEYSLSTLL